MTKRTRFDLNSPGATALRDKIVHGAFKTEGQLVAFPLSFPAVSVAIPADESKITALDVTEDGVIYGGTSGYAAHLFVAMFHGVTGMVFDMGVAERGQETTAVCCGKEKFFAAANGPDGGRIIVRELQETPFSLIQEWTIQRSPYTYLECPVPGEKITHAVATIDRQWVVGTTESAVFHYEFASDIVEVIGTVRSSGRLSALPNGTVIGRGDGDSLWICDPKERTLQLNAGTLPQGNWDCTLLWASDADAGLLYTADAEGRLFVYSVDNGWNGPLSQVPYTPVTSMAVTFDGRVFGSAGTDMQRMFCYDPDGGTVADIGVGASTLQQRRYCYEYGDAVTGRDGEIVFGEDDDLGHLWLYFPRIKRRRPR
jgi:hypothetical protein